MALRSSLGTCGARMITVKGRIGIGGPIGMRSGRALQSTEPETDGGACICRKIENGTLLGYSCACHPTRKAKAQGDSMPTQLTNQEKVICANSRISESEYL